MLDAGAIGQLAKNRRSDARDSKSQSKLKFVAVESAASTDERFYQSDPVAVAGRHPSDLVTAVPVGLAEGIFIFVSADRAESEVCGLLNLAGHGAGEERQAFPAVTQSGLLAFFRSCLWQERQVDGQLRGDD
jgi:hypothetical protein